MRVIARKTIVTFYTVYATEKSSLEAFYKEIEAADCNKPSDDIEVYPHTDVITGRRFIFNINSNSYRLVADIEFKKKHVFFVWISTHAEYDKTDVKTITYVKSD